MIELTLEQLRKIAPKGRADLLQTLAVEGPPLFLLYEINTKARLTHFLAQIAHESGGFKYVREIWGPTPAQTKYEGRTDLGNTAKGDGKRFMGRGYIQLTGRANYRLYGQKLGLALENTPSLAENPKVALQLALEYWKTKGLNQYADRNDIETITKKINGGYNGLADRKAYLKKAQDAIPEFVKGEAAVVKKVEALGYDSVTQFQRDQGLKPDGIAGPATSDAADALQETKTASGEAPKVTTSDLLKDKDIIQTAIAVSGPALIGGISGSLILQIVIAIVILGVFGYLAYKKLKEQ